MKHSDTPHFRAILAWVLGHGAALALTLNPVALVALFLCGLSLRRRTWWILVASLGALNGELRGVEDFSRFLDGEIVEVEGTLVSSWVPGKWSRSSDLKVDSLRVGARCYLSSGGLKVSYSGLEEPPPMGSRVRIKGILRQPSVYRNLSPRRVGGWRIGVKSSALIQTLDAPDPIEVATRRVRTTVRSSLESLGEGQGVALVQTLVLGDQRALDYSFRRGLQRQGLAHFLAVSGLHVGLLVTGIWFLGCWLPWRLRFSVALTTGLFYLCLVGPRPSLVRSVFMLALLVASLLLRRCPHPLHALGNVVMVMLAVNPGNLTDLSFHLTVAATAGILGWSGRIRQKLAFLPSWLSWPLGVTLAAQLATLPWALGVFGLISWLGALWNLGAVPLVSLILLLGLVSLPVIWLLPSMGPGVAAVVNLLTFPLEALATIPPAWQGTQAVSAPWWIAFLSVALPVGLIHGPSRSRWLLVLVLSLGFNGHSCPESPSVEVVQLDVGQGDALLLRDSSGSTILIDGGGWSSPGLGARILAPALGELGVSDLTVLVVTHGDRDHCGGLMDLVGEMTVGEVWLRSDELESPCGQHFVDRGVTIRWVSEGERRLVGLWSLDVLSRKPDPSTQDNDRSLVVLARAMGRNVLITGDIEAKGEMDLLSSKAELLKADILKVAHHGSRTSSSQRFLEAVNPRLALISVGRRNSYGHPSSQVIQRLEAMGIWVLRTDQHGLTRVRWRSDQIWQIETR